MTWAFGLPLKPAAKMVLVAIADVVDDNGVGWVEIARLEHKSSQSRATVQRRLKRLEDIGLLARFQRFAQDGRRMADEFRLSLGVSARELLHRPREDADVIYGIDEEPDEGASEPDSHVDPPSQSEAPPVANCDGEGISYLTRGGSQQVTPLNETNHNQVGDSPPYPPPGGSGQVDRVGEGEPEHFGSFFENCLGWRTMDRQRAAQAFGLLTSDERERAAAASPLHSAECTKFKRKSKDAHKLLAERFWERYGHARLNDAQGGYHAADGDAAKAIGELYAIAGKSEYFRTVVRRPGAPIFFPHAVGPQLLALAKAPPRDAWVTLNHRQAGAWEAFLQPLLRMTRHRLQEGCVAPWPWPPSVEGKVYDVATLPGELSEDDADALAREGMR